MTTDGQMPDWLAGMSDEIALLEALSEHAARVMPQRRTKRLVDAMLRFHRTADAGLETGARLQRVYAGDRELADYLPHFMAQFGHALDATSALVPVLREREENGRERLLSTLLLVCEALLGPAHVDCASQAMGVARGELSLDEALRVVALAQDARARAIELAAPPEEPPGTWTVEDAVQTLSMPVWPRLERDGEDDETMNEPEKRLYRRTVTAKYRMPFADRALVLECYRQWGAYEGWPVTSDTELGLDVIEIKPERPRGQHGCAFSIWVGVDTVQLRMHWIAPSDIEHKLNEIAEGMKKLGL